jgi:hypothetical protein
MFILFAALLLLPACQDEGSKVIDDASTSGDKTDADEGVALTERDSPTESAAAAVKPGDTVSLDALIEKLEGLDAGVVEEVERMRERRLMSRESEDKKVHSAAVGVSAALAASCDAAKPTEEFRALVAVEEASTANDREALAEVRRGGRNCGRWTGYSTRWSCRGLPTTQVRRRPFPGGWWVASPPRRATSPTRRRSARSGGRRRKPRSCA